MESWLPKRGRTNTAHSACDEMRAKSAQDRDAVLTQNGRKRSQSGMERDGSVLVDRGPLSLVPDDCIQEEFKARIPKARELNRLYHSSPYALPTR